MEMSYYKYQVLAVVFYVWLLEVYIMIFYSLLQAIFSPISNSSVPESAEQQLTLHKVALPISTFSVKDLSHVFPPPSASTQDLGNQTLEG